MAELIIIILVVFIIWASWRILSFWFPSKSNSKTIITKPPERTIAGLNIKPGTTVGHSYQVKDEAGITHNNIQINHNTINVMVVEEPR